MCGFIYNVTDFPMLVPLFKIADYSPDEVSDIIQRPYLRPTDNVLTLVPTRKGIRLMGSTWWLATHPDGSLNSSVTSFNSKSSKVGSSPLHLQKPRSIRSVVIGQGFCEWQPIYKGELKRSDALHKGLDVTKLQPARKIQHRIEPGNTEPLMLFAAVSKLRLDHLGNPKVNSSIVTLPPHQGFSDIHSKSFPLILRPNELADWLSPKKPFSDFSSLLAMDTFRDSFKVSRVSADFSTQQFAQKLSPKDDQTK